MNKKPGQHKTYPKKMLMIGFGSIGKAVLPLIFKHTDFKSQQITIISKHIDGNEIVQHYGVHLEEVTVTPENYINLSSGFLKEGDFLLNLSVGVSSLSLIEWCQNHGVLYLDTCTEPWEGGYLDKNLSPALRTNYSLREAVLKLKKSNSPTAVITHGANPGLVSHFLKQALLNVAHDNGLEVKPPKNEKEWASLANQLHIKNIQIAEQDTQVTTKIKYPNEFVNTWSVDGFVSEGGQPAELGWGTHEKHWPTDAHQHEVGPKCAIYLDFPGAGVKVRTWTPLLGPAHGFLITHAESISISNFLTLVENAEVVYRPTVHYAYVPCPDAILSLHEFASNEWKQPQKSRVIVDEVVDGTDALGILLSGNSKGSYWYGSQLSIHEARKLAPYNNATSLQVAIGVIAGINWAIDNPKKGLVEPEDIDHNFVLNLAFPYLGKVDGFYVEWDPLQKRESLFEEELDRKDPWQFSNIRVK